MSSRFSAFVSRSTFFRPPAVRALGAFATLLVLAGCQSAPEAPESGEPTKYTLENSARFLAFNRTGQHAVSCTGLMEIPLANGGLQVVANIKNREAQPVRVQASCAFKDATGNSFVSETPWQDVTLPENGTVAVRFTADNPLARRYVVRVRDPR